MPAGSTPAPRTPARPRRGGVVVPHHPTFWQRLGAGLVFLALRAIALTLRPRWNISSDLAAPASLPQAIYVVWHNRLALCLEIYRAYVWQRRGGPGLAAMVSASRDGGFLARILELYGVQPVRGSSSRRGPQALLELTSWAEQGYDLAMTPDGPRGPRYVAQAGVIALAQVTGLPIVPASYALSRAWRLRSWDGFLVPLPFARWEIVVGSPLRVPREATEAEREVLRQRLEATLRELTHD